MAMMIQKFHKLIASKVVWICFILFVVVAFVGLYIPGVADYNQQVAAAAAGTLDGEPVDQEEFRNHYFNCYLRVTMSTLRTPTITDEVDSQLRAMAWRRLVSMREAKKLGLSASKEEIINQIKSLPIFAQGGGYTPAQYNGFIQAVLVPMGINEVQFEQHIEEELVLQKLTFMVSQGAMIPPSELTRRYGMFRDQFTVEYITVKPEQVEESVTVSEEDAQAYLDANPDEFRIPEKVEVEVVQFDVNDYLEDVEPISEEEVQLYYDNNQDQFSYLGEEPVPVEETAPLDLLSDDLSLEPLDLTSGVNEDVVPEADAALEEEEDVLEVASEEADPAEEETAPEADTTETDEVAANEEVDTPLDATTEETAELDEPVEPVMRSVVKTKPLDEVKEEIVAILLKQKARNLASEKATDFVVALAPNRNDEATPFEEVTKTFGVTTATLAPFAENEPVLGIGAGPRFNSAAFALEDVSDQYFSDAILSENAVYVLKLKQRFPSRVPAMDEVRKQVFSRAKEKAVLDAVYARADEVVAAAQESLKSGKTFTQATSSFAVTPEKPEPFTAATGLLETDFSDLLIRSVLVLNEGELTEPLPSADGAVVAYLAKREAGDPGGFSTIRDQLTQTLRQRQVATLVETWQEYLLKKAGFVDLQERALTDDEPVEDETADVES